MHVLHQYGTLLDELHTFSTLLWTRILRFGSPFLRRMEKCAQSMPQVLEFRISSQELHGAGRVYDEQALAKMNESQGLTLHRDALWTYTPTS